MDLNDIATLVKEFDAKFDKKLDDVNNKLTTLTSEIGDKHTKAMESVHKAELSIVSLKTKQVMIVAAIPAAITIIINLIIPLWKG
jgi:Mg2+ and Co2+ transporter CorA